ncbi:hypothetical protein BH10ACT8_BH10ACT8_20380 [soil metagenome]
MTILMTLIAGVVWVGAGRGLVRLVGGNRLGLSPLPLVAAWLLSGVAAGAFVTSVLAATGLPVRPWPLSAPLLILLAVAGGRPAAGSVRGRPWRKATISDLPSVLAAILAIPLVLAAASRLTTGNDEYAIWAFKAKVLLAVGRVDPFILAGDPAYTYANRDYPLLIPSIQVWLEGWIGHADDRLDHFAVAFIVAAGFVLVTALVGRLAGPLAAVLSVLGIASMTALATNATQFVGDATNCMFALVLLLLLAIGCTTATAEGNAAIRLAIPFAAGAAMTKNEGGAFVLALLIAAAVVIDSRRRRSLALPLAAAVVGLLPWTLWSRTHGLKNIFVNTSTLKPSSFAHNLHNVGPVLGQMTKYWIGPSGLAAVAVGAVLVAGLARAETRRTLLFLLLAIGLALGALLFTYVVSPLQGIGFLTSNIPRVIVFPSAAAWVIGSIAAAWAVKLLRPNADRSLPVEPEMTLTDSQ